MFAISKFCLFTLSSCSSTQRFTWKINFIAFSCECLLRVLCLCLFFDAVKISYTSYTSYMMIVSSSKSYLFAALRSPRIKARECKISYSCNPLPFSLDFSKLLFPPLTELRIYMATLAAHYTSHLYDYE